MDKKKFKKLLKAKTNCSVQHNGWTCGTCFFALNEELTNKDWQSLLYYRGDYSKSELLNCGDNYMQSIQKIYKIISQ